MQPVTEAFWPPSAKALHLLAHGTTPGGIAATNPFSPRWGGPPGASVGFSPPSRVSHWMSPAHPWLLFNL